MLLGQAELSLDSIFQVLLFLAQHLLCLPKSGQGFLGAGSSSALGRASPFKELAQLAHGVELRGERSPEDLRAVREQRQGEQLSEIRLWSWGPRPGKAALLGINKPSGAGDTLSWAFPGGRLGPAPRRARPGRGGPPSRTWTAGATLPSGNSGEKKKKKKS